VAGQHDAAGGLGVAVLSVEGLGWGAAVGDQVLACGVGDTTVQGGEQATAASLAVQLRVDEHLAKAEDTSAMPALAVSQGLLHARDDAVAEAIIHATRDDAWRVPEMAGKVIAAHRVGDALDAIAALPADPVPRVRAAAQRAVMMLTASGN
jgi:hypothetical protein